MSESLGNIVDAKIKYRDDLQKIVTQLNGEIDYAEKQKRSAERERIYPLAELLHDVFCRYDHGDQCGWGYEGNNWDAAEHVRWVDIAERLLEGIKRIQYDKPTESDIIGALKFAIDNKQKMALLDTIKTFAK